MATDGVGEGETGEAKTVAVGAVETEARTAGVGEATSLFLLRHPTNVVEIKSNKIINAIFFIS